MSIYFEQKALRPSQFWLVDTSLKPICALNGVVEHEIDAKQNLNNSHTLSFSMDKYDEEGNITSGYDLIDSMSIVYAEEFGYFLCDVPSEEHASSDKKTVHCDSLDTQFMHRSIINFRVNTGQIDDRALLAENNVDKDPFSRVEFAREQIKFYNPDNPQLSLIDIVLKESGFSHWHIGHVDQSAKTYQRFEDGELVETQTELWDEIGRFDIPNQTIYTFFTQTLAKFFEVMVVFDNKNLTINFYRVESLGRDTGIVVGFRNLQESNTIEASSPKSLMTRFRVAGANNLGVTFVNFGSNFIENLSYFLNTKYMSEELIEKYQMWHEDMIDSRAVFTDLSRRYNTAIETRSELYNRLPIDAAGIDYDTWSLEDLQNELLDFQAQLLGIESFFVNEEDEVDWNALFNSLLRDDYLQIRDVVLVNIQRAIDNKDAQTDDDLQKPVDIENWEWFGLDELLVKRNVFENEMAVYVRNGYHVPWTHQSPHSREMHEFNYERYLFLAEQLLGECPDSLGYAIRVREQQIDAINEYMEAVQEDRNAIIAFIDKETWSGDGGVRFTQEDLNVLAMLYNDGDYVNENVFIHSRNSQNEVIDEQLKLLHAAEKELVAASQPQYTITAELDNFLAMTEYSDFQDNFKLGDYINLELSEDYYVKLRVIGMTYNPMKYENDLEVEFSNMVTTYAGRNDFARLLELNTGGSRNAIAGTQAGMGSQEDNMSVRELINRMMQTLQFRNAVGEIAGNVPGRGGSGGSISIDHLDTTTLNALMIKVVDLYAENGFFGYLQAQLIAADRIIAESGKFNSLETEFAHIQNLLNGTIASELGLIIKLTAQNVSIDEAVIRDIIAANMTVAMLQASDISTNSMNIVSDDGGFKIVGNTMQFFDKNNNLRIQIGRDANDDFTFTLYDETGKGILIDENGIHESAISDGLIRNDMIADKAITRDKLAFQTVEADEDGNVHASKVLINGQGVDIEFTNITQKISEITQVIDEGGLNGKDGVSPILTVIHSTAGVIFKNNVISTVLTARLFRDDQEIDPDGILYVYKWTKSDRDGNLDEIWNQNNDFSQKSVYITAADIGNPAVATFECRIGQLFSTQQGQLIKWYS